MEIAKYLDKIILDFGGASGLMEKEHFHCFEKTFSIVVNLLSSLGGENCNAILRVEGALSGLPALVVISELKSKISYYADITYYSAFDKFFMSVTLDTASLEIEFIMDPILVYVTTTDTK